MAKRVVLAYSGGLDTSVAVKWLQQEMGVEVICVAANVGQGGDWDEIKARALATGAVAYRFRLREDGVLVASVAQEGLIRYRG